MTTTTTKFFPTPARPVAPVSLDYTLTSTEKNFHAVASNWPSNVAVDPNIQYPTSSLQMLPPPPASSSPSSQSILQSHHLLPPLSQRQQRPPRFADNELPLRDSFAPYVADGGVEPRNARKRSFSSHFQGDASWEMDRTSYETLYNISSDIRQAVSVFPIANAANGPNGSADVSLATTTILPSIQELDHLIDRAGLMVMVFEKAQNKGVDRKLDNQLSSFRYAEKPKMKYKRKNAQGQLHCHSCKRVEERSLRTTDVV
ncbi:hypothetical protein BC938DRAFT_479124 [Jimgerdemannia flammicorona]|uniref:GATA-type domain-containing protein n=1 Tax=Jimgerdemannia flammicorona TaxID=994334 RepID=A0A433QLI3_9FUNG|nr:hypothetical protein BC938DRAFT_479124 [Jimgerdemannia flammicorona]